MGTYQRKDHYYRKAKEQGLPSRASFKIEEILNKFPLVGTGDRVLDLGAAPGGWTVILAKAVGPKGKVLALDLQKLQTSTPEQVEFFQGDLGASEAMEWLEKHLAGKKASCVCSDMSPKLSGIQFKDAYFSYELGLKSLEVAQKFLRPGGSMVTKIFPGEEFPNFLGALRKAFEKVKTFEPKSSRKTSREVYVLGMGYRPEKN